MTLPPEVPLGEDVDATLERDLAVLAWLECAPQLCPETTAHLCSALEEWALLGEATERIIARVRDAFADKTAGEDLLAPPSVHA